MTRTMELRHPYPVPPDQLRAVLTDPNLITAKLRELGGPNAALISRTEDGPKVTVVTRVSVPRTKLPALARRFIAGDLNVDRTETWTTPTVGSLRVSSNAPGELTGTAHIHPASTGSVMTTAAYATARVPLVGRRIERAVLDAVAELATAEHNFTLQWLRDRPQDVP
jgi:hypothetical protein